MFFNNRQSNLSKANQRSLKSFSVKVLSSIGLASAVTFSAYAATWSSSNVQILNGSDYELGASDRTILTYENALGWKYGDSFLFVDVTEPIDTGTTYYGEWSPRFSLSKMTGKEMKYGIIKDVMVSTTLEMGQGVRGQLFGVGLPLDIPGFAFANFNLYARNSERDFATAQTDTGAQVTLTWKRPFSVGSAKLSFEGFLDYAWGEDGGSNPKEDNLITAPRLLLDVGALAGGKPGNVEMGVEHQIWRNKFGVKDVDEDVTQAMVKWTF